MREFKTTIGLPVIFLEEGDDIEEIEHKFFYVIGEKGVYIKKNNRLYNSVKKCTDKELKDVEVVCDLNLKQIPLKFLQGCISYCDEDEQLEDLEDIETGAKVQFTKIPNKTFRQIRQFFADIYKEHKSEVAILLYYNFEAKTWLWSIPEQQVSGASVSYDEAKGVLFVLHDGSVTEECPEQYSKMGSIHSHASMSAFHSATDDGDEFSFDGLHVTIGNFNLAECTYSCRWIVAGESHKTTIVDVIAGEAKEEYPTQIQKLVSKNVAVTRRIGGYGAQFGHQGAQFYQHGSYHGTGHQTPYNQNNRSRSTAISRTTSSTPAVKDKKKYASQVGVTLYHPSTKISR